MKRASYVVLTIHRPANVDDRATLERIVEALCRIAFRITLVFPTHPRTRKNLEACALLDALKGDSNVRLLSPVGYIDFLSLVQDARLVVTDSGGGRRDNLSRHPMSDIAAQYRAPDYGERRDEPADQCCGTRTSRDRHLGGCRPANAAPRIVGWAQQPNRACKPAARCFPVALASAAFRCGLMAAARTGSQ